VPRPRFVLAVDAVTSERLLDLTRYVAEMSGMSAATNARKAGVATPPDVGPANTVFAVCVAREIARVPDEVTGDPDTDKNEGTVCATLVTVPEPPGVPHEAAVPLVVRNFPLLEVCEGNRLFIAVERLATSERLLAASRSPPPDIAVHA
jgi:hypothetical protein